MTNLRRGGPRRLDVRAAAIAVFTLLLMGCNTVPPARVTDFRQATDRVKTQADTAFASINEVAAADNLEWAIRQPTLKESNFSAGITAEDIAKWDNALGIVGTYADSMSALLAPDQPNNFASAAQDLATSIKTVAPNALPSPQIATAFTELGRVLIQAFAEKTVQRVAQRTDPAVQNLFSQMAHAVGDTAAAGPGAASLQTSGLRGTVRAHWQQRMAELAPQYLAAKDLEARRKIGQQFIDLMRHRDAQDLQLMSLRRSLVEVGVAHAALARGADFDFAAAVGRIQQELDATRSLSDFFSGLKPKPKLAGG